MECSIKSMNICCKKSRSNKFANAPNITDQEYQDPCRFFLKVDHSLPYDEVPRNGSCWRDWSTMNVWRPLGPRRSHGILGEQSGRGVSRLKKQFFKFAPGGR